MSGMDVNEHIAALDREGKLLAAAAEQAGPAAVVPSCPAWHVRDLLRHMGHVHRWAAGYVVERQLHQQPGEPDEAEVLRSGPPDAELVGWVRDGHARLVTALAAADPDLACWTFLEAPSPLAFWARRQAHETAIHRVDAELAAGGAVTPASAEFADDGVDELIIGIFGRDPDQLTAEQRAGARRSVQVLATDTGTAWRVELTADGRLAASVQRGRAASDCTLAGPAAGLYLLVWNRADPAAAGVEVSGDAAVLAAWQAGMHLVWE
jgi:uncharacterized protein (TIGR03083 family)